MNDLLNLNNLYTVIALTATFLYVVKMTLYFFSGVDVEVDASFNDITETDASFSFISIQSILAFFMGFGWCGLAVNSHFKTTLLVSLIIAIDVGLIFMFISAYLMYLARKLEKTVKIDLKELLDKKGRAYTSFKNKSKGQIEIDLNGRLSVLDAYNISDDNIPSFSPIRVTKVENNTIYIIKD